MTDGETGRPFNRKEAAEYLGVTPRTVSDYAKKGLLKRYRGPRRLYFLQRDLDDFVRGGGDAE